MILHTKGIRTITNIEHHTSEPPVPPIYKKK